MEDSHNHNHFFLMKIFAFILAGGSGERFWPLSRNKTPKHLLRIFNEKTLIEHTVDRLRGVIPDEQIFVLTNAMQADAIRAVLPDLAPGNVVAEPAKRDTAPACALATAIVAAEDQRNVCILLPADAMIHNVEVFRRQLLTMAEAAAKHDAIVTMAIPPKYAATGFGYLRLGNELSLNNLVSVDAFVEKPDEKTAEKYLFSNDYAWNAGIFAWRAEWFLKEAQRLLPPLGEFICGFPKGDFTDYLNEKFPDLPKISVDYAILEKAREVIAVRAGFDWDDVGSWLALPTHLGCDDAKNCMSGQVVAVDSRHNIAFSSGRSVVLCGVNDLVVVETPDAILVCKRDAVENIKKIPALLPPELQ